MYVWVYKEFLEVREYIRLPEMGRVAGDAVENVVKSKLEVEFPLKRRGKIGHGSGMSSRSVPKQQVDLLVTDRTCKNCEVPFSLTLRQVRLTQTQQFFLLYTTAYNIGRTPPCGAQPPASHNTFVLSFFNSILGFFNGSWWNPCITQSSSCPLAVLHSSL